MTKMVSLNFRLENEKRSVIEEIYKRTNKVLYGRAYDILKDKGLAEDAVHEAFIRLAKNLDKIDDPESRRTFNFLITIVENISKTMYMKRKREFAAPLEDYSEKREDEFETADEVLIRQEEYSVLREAIGHLDEKYREAMILSYVYGMKEKEIAEELGISLANAGVRIHRAKTKVKEYIKRKEAGNK